PFHPLQALQEDLRDRAAFAERHLIALRSVLHLNPVSSDVVSCAAGAGAASMVKNSSGLRHRRLEGQGEVGSRFDKRPHPPPSRSRPPFSNPPPPRGEGRESERLLGTYSSVCDAAPTERSELASG